MKFRLLVVCFVLAAFAFGMALSSFSFATTPTGQINYFNVSGGSCTSTAWTGGVGVDGNNPGFFPNNVGGPQPTAIVGTGSICIQVILTGATPSTDYVITSNKMSGTLTVTTDSLGDGSAEAVFTSSFSGQCTTVPITMDPESPYVLQSGIAHVFVGTGYDSTDNVYCTPPTNGVPQFPLAGALGFAMVFAIAVPVLIAMRHWRTPIQAARKY
jgi:hypothetical protein